MTKPEESPMLKAALQYAALGYPVFPCWPRTKVPMTRHGFYDATTGPEQIKQWWTRQPDANIAMPTGAASGVVILDIDPRHGGHYGYENLIAENEPLPEAPEALTSGGGRHISLAHPGFYVKGDSDGNLAAGVDIKGDGGYAMMPPSVHPGGWTYEWELSSHIADVPPPPCPDWLADRFRELATKSGRDGPVVGADGNPIPEGQRNNTLARLAGGMRRMGMSRDEMLAALLATNEGRCKPPLSEKEVEQVASSISRYEPDQITVAVVENHWGQMADGEMWANGLRVDAACLADVAPEPVRWLWPGRFALGKLSLIAGEPGLGKSFFTLDMAARISRGGAWPCDEGELDGPGSVVLLSAEDDIRDTIAPRLIAADADRTRIHAIKAVYKSEASAGSTETFVPFNLLEHVPLLERMISHAKACRLVVVDPVSAFLGGTDSHNNSEVRSALVPLSEMAARHGVAVVAVTHLNKGQGSAINRVIGSIAFTAAARAAYVVTRDEDDPDRRLLLPVKNNLGRDREGFAYRLEGDPVPRLEWEPHRVDITADEAVSRAQARGPEPTARHKAEDWLMDFLADGPRPAKEVFEAAEAEGHAKVTIKRAKRAIGAESEKQGFDGEWVWLLPGSGPLMTAGRSEADE